MERFFTKGRRDNVAKILIALGQISAAGWLAEVIFFARLSRLGKILAAIIILAIFIMAIIVTPERSDD